MCQTKHCPICKESKNVELFTKVNEDYYYICKSCRREKYYESKGEIPPKLKPKSSDPDKQICTRCETEKPLSDFRKGHKKNGTTSRCRLCDIEISKNNICKNIILITKASNLNVIIFLLLTFRSNNGSSVFNLYSTLNILDAK